MIRVENLVFQYPRSKHKAVNDISFTVPQGEIIGFLGPNGAGKSTTQKILTGLLKGYSGDISIFGKDLKAWGSEFYERIGVSFELPNHFKKLTAMENLAFFRSLYSVDTKEPSELLGLVSLEKDAKTRIAQYSKGMKMRLNFIRALINNPELIFLDEPTSGLDPVNARKIKDIILELKRKGTTIFLTTHNMAVADELCDRVAFIVDGRIALIDNPKELEIKYGKKVVSVEYRSKNEKEVQEFAMKGLGDNDQFINLLKNAEVETIHTQEATLEDIFIKITGRKLV